MDASDKAHLVRECRDQVVAARQAGEDWVVLADRLVVFFKEVEGWDAPRVLRHHRALEARHGLACNGAFGAGAGCLSSPAQLGR